MRCEAWPCKSAMQATPQALFSPWLRRGARLVHGHGDACAWEWERVAAMATIIREEDPEIQAPAALHRDQQPFLTRVCRQPFERLRAVSSLTCLN